MKQITYPVTSGTKPGNAASRRG